MSDELKRRMEQREKGIKPPYMFPDAVDRLFPTMQTTTCGNVLEDVWKAAWDEARLVVDEYQRDRLQEPVTGENTLRPEPAPPDIQYHMDDEVEIIHECYQNLMRLDDEKARKRALYYLLERMGISSEF